MSTDTSGNAATADMSVLECAPNMETSTGSVTGGEELREFASRHSFFLAWVAMITVFLIMTIFILWTMGYVTFGKSTVSSYSSSFITPTGTSKFGNNSNWRMTNGDAGYGSSVDIAEADRGLGFYTGPECPVHKSGYTDHLTNKNHFVDHATIRPGPGVGRFVDHAVPRPGVGHFVDHAVANNTTNNTAVKQFAMRNPSIGKSHLDNPDPAAVAAAQAATAQQERVARQKAYEEQNMSTCNEGWDPLASEEARVLASVGTYRQASAAMGTFNKVLNDNCNATLTDAQLEAIMQGGEPFSVSHFDQLPVQNNQTVSGRVMSYQ